MLGRACDHKLDKPAVLLELQQTAAPKKWTYVRFSPKISRVEVKMMRYVKWQQENNWTWQILTNAIWAK